jgi:hypothetical protein
MDTSFWTNINPKIEIVPTTKKYYNQYLYKLVVHAPGGRSIEVKGSIAEHIENRKIWDRQINQFGWWGHNKKELELADTEFLHVIRDIKNNSTVKLKIRVEEPYIQFYTESVADLQSIASMDLIRFKKYSTSVHMPASKETEDLLNSGAIIKTKDLGYRYKIMLRDGKIPMETKNSILSYLNGLGPENVRVPRNLQQTLENNKHGYLWGCYFYANDLSNVTFLSLIAPELISNIHELVVRTNK